jgi:hypothetical protein
VTDTPSSYLVLASQRSGSTLLVESLRATGVAGEPQEFFQYLPTTSQSPQPREWFAGIDDESVLTLLDPLDEGKPDLAPASIWRDYIRTVGRTPNGVWGGKLMWNQTPLLLSRAKDLPDRSGAGLLSAVRDVVGSDPVLIHVYRPDVVSQAVSFWRAVQTRVWRGYLCTIGLGVVFSLRPWSAWIPTGFPVSRGTWDTPRRFENFAYEAFTLFGMPFQALLLSPYLPYRGPTTLIFFFLRSRK